MFYDVFEINAVISKYMPCEFETRDVRVRSYLTVVMNCRNMIKKPALQAAVSAAATHAK